MRILDRENLIDIVNGCAILGTGGGGPIEIGIHFIDKALQEGKTFKLIDIDDVPTGETLCTPYMLGSVTPVSAEEEKKYEHLPKNPESPVVTAYKQIEKTIDGGLYGTICCELGAANTPISFYLAAMVDGYIIDADPAGRAVPEITHSTYYLNGLPAAPISIANNYGECFICENILDDLRAEDIVRSLAMVSKNEVGCIDHVMKVEDIKNSVIKGTISKALSLGKAQREAISSGKDVATEVAKHGQGYVAFNGKVKEFNFVTDSGFTLGNILLDGKNEFEGENYYISVKNENMSAKRNGKIEVTIPDLICCINADTGVPITNPNFSLGMNVSVIILPAPKEFTTEKGLAAFGPAYLGLEQAYVPAVEQYFKQK